MSKADGRKDILTVGNRGVHGVTDPEKALVLVDSCI